MSWLKLFLTNKRKLHKLTRQPRPLCSFAFKKDKKGALGKEVTQMFFNAISLIVTRALLLPQLDVAYS